MIFPNPACQFLPWPVIVLIGIRPAPFTCIIIMRSCVNQAAWGAAMCAIDPDLGYRRESV